MKNVAFLKTSFCTALTALFMTAGASAQSLPQPFAYPTGLLDAPATLAEAAGGQVTLGETAVVLEETSIADIAALTGAKIRGEGRGEFQRGIICVSTVENKVPSLIWFIASGSPNVTEVQTVRAASAAQAAACPRLSTGLTPVRFGKLALGMTADEVRAQVGAPSHTDSEGWHYWFNQKFFRNSADMQELELNWLAAEFGPDGKVRRAFVSQVSNL